MQQTTQEGEASKASVRKDPDEPIVKWLISILESDDVDYGHRVDAGVAIIHYAKKWEHNNESAALRSIAMRHLRSIAVTDGADVNARLRAAMAVL